MEAVKAGVIIGAMFADSIKNSASDDDAATITSTMVKTFSGQLSKAGPELSARGLKVLVYLFDMVENTAREVRQIYNMH